MLFRISARFFSVHYFFAELKVEVVVLVVVTYRRHGPDDCKNAREGDNYRCTSHPNSWHRPFPHFDTGILREGKNSFFYVFRGIFRNHFARHILVSPPSFVFAGFSHGKKETDFFVERCFTSRHRFLLGSITFRPSEF